MRQQKLTLQVPPCILIFRISSATITFWRKLHFCHKTRPCCLTPRTPAWHRMSLHPWQSHPRNLQQLRGHLDMVWIWQRMLSLIFWWGWEGKSPECGWQTLAKSYFLLHHGGTSGLFSTTVAREGYTFLYSRLIIIFSLLSTFQHALCRYRIPNPHDQRHYTSIFQERLYYLTMPALGLEICFCKLAEFSLGSLVAEFSLSIVCWRSVGILCIWCIVYLPPYRCLCIFVLKRVFWRSSPCWALAVSVTGPVSSRGTDRAASETPEVTIQIISALFPCFSS